MRGELPGELPGELLGGRNCRGIGLGIPGVIAGVSGGTVGN